MTVCRMAVCQMTVLGLTVLRMTVKNFEMTCVFDVSARGHVTDLIRYGFFYVFYHLLDLTVELSNQLVMLLLWT